MKLNEYVTLGRSGLRVSPLCLGTMTFGTEWGWGSEEDAARAVFSRYLERGGNFVDTADMYTNGKARNSSENSSRTQRCVTKWSSRRSLHSTPSREIPMLAGTAARTCTEPSRLAASSANRLHRSLLDACMDMITPVEEVVASLDMLVKAGKVRYIGFSDVPRGMWRARRPWPSSKAARGLPRYSSSIPLSNAISNASIFLPRRNWASPSFRGVHGGRILSGKYKRDGQPGTPEGRLDLQKAAGTTIFERDTERNWKILDVLLDVRKNRPADR